MHSMSNSLLCPFCMKCSLGISKFLEEISSLHWSLRKAFSSLFAILWNSAFKWVYLSFSPLPFASLFSAICKAPSNNHFAFLHFFFLGMVFITTSCIMSWTSIHSSSGTLSDLIPWIYLPLLLYNNKGFDLAHIWMVLVVFPYFLKFMSEFCNKKFMIWVTVSSWFCLC